MEESEKQLAIAVLDVLLCVSEHNLAQGTTATVLINRNAVNALAAALEVRHPGALARAREIEKEG